MCVSVCVNVFVCQGGGLSFLPGLFPLSALLCLLIRLWSLHAHSSHRLYLFAGVCVCVCDQTGDWERVSEWGTTHQKHSANWLLPLCHVGTEIFLSFHTHTPKSNYPQKNRTQQRILGEGGFKKCVCVKIIILSNSSASLISLKAEAGLIANRCCIYKIINLGCLRGSGGQHAGLCFVTCVCVCICVWHVAALQMAGEARRAWMERSAPFLLRWLVIITPHHSLTHICISTIHYSSRLAFCGQILSIASRIFTLDSSGLACHLFVLFTSFFLSLSLFLTVKLKGY